MTDMESRLRTLYKTFSEAMWGAGNGYTREKGYRAWEDFWSLMVCAQVQFADDDLKVLRKWSAESRYRGGQMPDEYHYSLAADDGNIGFCRAYEKLVGRKPFIWKGIDYGGTRGFNVHRTVSKTQGRLIEDVWFTWQGEQVKVTSFNDEKGTLVACAYHPDPEGYEPSKIRRRFTISHKDFKEEKRKLKGQQHGLAHQTR